MACGNSKDSLDKNNGTRMIKKFCSLTKELHQHECRILANGYLFPALLSSAKWHVVLQHHLAPALVTPCEAKPKKWNSHSIHTQK